MTDDRGEVALTVNADDLLVILRKSPHAQIDAFGGEHSLRCALVRTASYDPLRHEVVLVLKTTDVQPVPRGSFPPFVFVRRKSETESAP